ncbi:MAG: Autoinducer 2 import ATP-binding protein LsrA [candidate division BRC1 bacterium ADurb.BinA364]|nr:MAG: Autoinducer 2 import ATP-binding protein LsrA [candidate division BRC1 bacterium ADurb.BinA364]
MEQSAKMPPDASPPAVEMRAIVKTYGATRANDGADFLLRANTIHALVGENGAGKSTLMRILGGLERSDSGEIRIAGRVERIGSPLAARRLGLAIVPQQLSLIEPFTIEENLSLAGVLGRRRPGSRASHEEARRLAARYGFDLDSRRCVADLAWGERLRVELLKALGRQPRVLILDEPTAILAPAELEALFALMRRLRGEGIGIVFISHSLPEVMAAADDATVLRQGRRAGGGPVADLSEAQIARMMIGREPPSAPRAERRFGVLSRDPILELRNVSIPKPRAVGIAGASLEIRAGEIVGVAGVDGNGQEALVEGLFGIRKISRGEIVLHGRAIERLSPRARLARGLATLPPDRARGGLALAMTLGENLALSHTRRPGFALMGWLNPRDTHIDSCWQVGQSPHPNPGQTTRPAGRCRGYADINHGSCEATHPGSHQGSGSPEHRTTPALPDRSPRACFTDDIGHHGDRMPSRSPPGASLNLGPNVVVREPRCSQITSMSNTSVSTSNCSSGDEPLVACLANR